MKLILFVILMILPFLSMATSKSYHISTRILIDGQLVSAPRLTTSAGEFAEILQGDSKDHLKLKVIFYETSNDSLKEGLFIHYEIDYRSGSQVLSSKPKFYVTPNAQGVFELTHTYKTLRLEVSGISMIKGPTELARL